ncbi:Sodium/calcium exchanger protein-domain-containing protein [Sordaria brevicollis]|uniref:Vacuolar calcium ion transporter n=1 Tax=Sordaria brevicollis TaxID=83679 RepID=A0AAE0PLP1_SORBR|nr:Sodium/calcium exchanger protein-domain-containing protein [Sordaria brevicollis]
MGNPLTNLISTVTIPFRNQIRRASTGLLSKNQNGANHPNGISNGNGYTYVNGTNGSTNGHLNGHINGHTNGYTTMADSERSPLLGGRWTTTESDDEFSWRAFLFDNKKTPGTAHSNPLVRYPTRVWNVTKVTLLSSWINILLIFVPLGIIAGERQWGAPAVFTLNFFAIIPLAAVLSFATEEIAHRLGETLGGLVNATFGNAVELIVSIVALRAGEIEVVQASMLGSILSNLLLVLGMCFLLGGIVNMRDSRGIGTEQTFASGTAQTTCSMMTLASASLIIPAALYNVLNHSDSAEKQASILTLSRGTSVILLLLYCAYLFFVLRTHKELFEPEAQAPQAAGEAVGDVLTTSSDEEEEPILSPLSAALVLIATTVIISYAADYMVDSIDDIAATGAISKTFIGLILIPIVGNAAEHVTACVVAVKNKMDLAMGVAIGSSIQIALLVTPSLVLLGWAIGQPMTLHFETFETIAFALSVMVVTYTVQDGRSNYLEGAMLMGLYVIIALAFWASPADALNKLSESFF